MNNFNDKFNINEPKLKSSNFIMNNNNNNKDIYNINPINKEKLKPLEKSIDSNRASSGTAKWMNINT